MMALTKRPVRIRRGSGRAKWNIKRGQIDSQPHAGLIAASFGEFEERSPKACDDVAVLRGSSERVSAAKFPDNRENTGNFERKAPLRLLKPTELRDFFGRIPCDWNREFFIANREKHRA